MKDYEILKKYREKIIEKMIECYTESLKYNEIQYSIYIWEDGKLEILDIGNNGGWTRGGSFGNCVSTLPKTIGNLKNLK